MIERAIEDIVLHDSKIIQHEIQSNVVTLVINDDIGNSWKIEFLGVTLFKTSLSRLDYALSEAYTEKTNGDFTTNFCNTSGIVVLSIVHGDYSTERISG